MAIAKKKIVLIGLLILAGVLAIIRFVIMKPVTEEKAEVLTGTTEMMNQKGSESGKMMGSGSGMMNAKTATVNTQYSNPGGKDYVSFTIAVDGSGVITKAETGVLAVNPISKTRQESFAAGLPAVLVGKKLSDVTKIDRVGGSSLTTNAFNEALSGLKAQI